MLGKRTLQGKSAFKFPVTAVFSARFVRKKLSGLKVSSIRIESIE